jgi:ribonuclease-3
MSSSSSTNNSNSAERDTPTARLERALGYQFRDLTLLRQALTHKSHGRPDNERLEFLGDAVLGFVVADRLYRLRPDEQEDSLSIIRASLVRRETLAVIADEIELGELLRLGGGVRKSGGHRLPSLLANTLEAIIGAVCLDGGIEAAASVIERLFGTRMMTATADAAKDAKTRLQELLQRAGLALPEYAVERVQGKTFTVSCRVAEFDQTVMATGPTRRAAETAAAAEMLEQVVRLVEESR